jgi:hypothetical protein
MVEFTCIPYADAVRRAQTQNVVVALFAIVLAGLLLFAGLLVWRAIGGGAS